MALPQHQSVIAARGSPPGVADPDPQGEPTGAFRDGVELPDDEGTAGAGLDDLDLEAVTGTDAVGRAGGITPPCSSAAPISSGIAGIARLGYLQLCDGMTTQYQLPAPDTTEQISP